jgi:hypothetical protein
MFTEMEVKDPEIKKIDTNTQEGYAEWSKLRIATASMILTTIVGMADANPNLIQALKDSVLKNANTGEHALDGYASGIATVVKAFHAQSDFKLVNDLSKLSISDVAEIAEQFGQGVQSLTSGKLFDIALHAPRIPAEQSFLKQVTDIPPKINSFTYGSDYRAGVGLMYQAMEKIWGKLYLGQESATPMQDLNQGGGMPPSQDTNPSSV